MKRINEVSALTGITKRTLQYYDDEGLLQVRRDENNSRMYDEDDLLRLWKILIYKEMGFKLSEIRIILDMSEELQLGAIEERMNIIASKKGELDLQLKLAEYVKTSGIPLFEGAETYKEYAMKLKLEIRE